MRQVGSTLRRRYRTWLAVLVTVPALVVGVGACGSDQAPAPAKVIADKGTPYGDLLVPEVSASVKDGAVDVTVDQPVTVKASGGVLGAVSMVNEAGTEVPGRLSPDGVTWSTIDPLGYNKRYTSAPSRSGSAGSPPRR